MNNQNLSQNLDSLFKGLLNIPSPEHAEKNYPKWLSSISINTFSAESVFSQILSAQMNYYIFNKVKTYIFDFPIFPWRTWHDWKTWQDSSSFTLEKIKKIKEKMIFFEKIIEKTEKFIIINDDYFGSNDDCSIYYIDGKIKIVTSNLDFFNNFNEKSQELKQVYFNV